MNRTQQRLLALSVLLAGLGLYFPVYRLIYQKSRQFLVPCQKYSGKEFKPRISRDDLPLRTPQVNQTQLPRQLADRAEIILVSGYEPNRKLDSGKVKVKIDRPNQKVLLVLTSYESIDWEISATSNTQIAGVIYSSYHPSTVTSNLDSNEVFPVNLPYAYEKENRNFVLTLQTLNRWFDVEKIDGFRGHYSLPNEIEISQLDAVDPSLTLTGYPIEESTSNSKFVFYDRNYEPVELTTREINNRSEKLSSVVNRRGVAVSPNGKQIYKITETGIIKRDRVSGEQYSYDLPDRFPELSWATDITYDSKRDLISLVSLGGEGYFYSFDVKKRRWLNARSLNNIDLKFIAYDRTSDRYIAWEQGYGNAGGNLWFIASNGELQLDTPRLKRNEDSCFNESYLEQLCFLNH